MPFLANRMEIKKIEKVEPNLLDKETNIVHIKNSDDASKHGLGVKKLHRIIRFEQSYLMKPYIMLNIRLRTGPKNELKNYFFKLMNNSIFGNTMEIVRDHKDIKLDTS